MKKYYLLILVLTLLMQCFTAIPVYSDNAYWTATYYGDTFASEANRDLYKAEINTNAKSVYEGEKSLLVQCHTENAIDGNKIEIKTPLTGNPATGKYNLKFNVRTTTAFDGEIIFGNTVLKISDMTSETVTPASGAKNWKEYSCEFDYTKTSDADFTFVFLKNIKAAYIDDVVLTTSDGTENLIADSGFENGIDVQGSVTPPPTPPDSGDDEIPDTPGDDVMTENAAYLPVSVLSSGYAGGILLSWKNPSTSALKDILIYDITDGTEISLEDEISVTPSKAVYYKAPCEESKAYQYKIVFSYTDAEDKIYYLSDTPGDKGNIPSGTWNLRRYMAGAAGFCPTEVYIDSTTGHESNTSLKIVSNIDRNIPELTSNIYALVNRSLSMESGKRYYISFWVKGENVVNNPCAHMNYSKFENSGTTMTGMTGTYDWRQKEYTYTYINQNSLTLVIEGMCDGLWFDDFECYEIDSEGNRVTDENLFSDGDFESIPQHITGEISDFKAEPKIGSIKLTYKKPIDKYNGMKLYQFIDGNYEYRGIISAEAEEFEITGLKENAEYSFKVVPFNGDRCDGEAVEFTVTTLLRDYHITEPVVYKGNTVTETLSGAGEYKVVTTGKNNLLENNLNYVQMVGIYKGNALVKAYSTKQSIPKTAQDSPYTKTETTFTLPDGEDYSVRIFIMDSKTNPELYHKLYLN